MDFLGGIAGAIGSMYGSKVSAASAERATEKQIAWERERAKNAHQWEVQDLQAAGLNPILSAGGSGATTGGISAPVPDTSGISNAGYAFADIMKSLSESGLNQANTAKAGADTANILQDTKNKISAQKLIEAQLISEQERSGLISAQKANQLIKNAMDEYDAEYHGLHFWNQEANTAAQTVNAGIGAAKDLLSGMLKGRGDKKNLKEFERTFSKTSYGFKNDY